jgi:hypothetical protein
MAWHGAAGIGAASHDVAGLGKARALRRQNEKEQTMSAATSEVVAAEFVKEDALAPAFVGLEPSSARQLREVFVPALVQIEEWERQAADLTVTDESQTAKMRLAGVMRKALKDVRVGVEKRRKEMNADSLARTKAVNHAAGIVTGLIEPLERRLKEQETFGERAAEARRDALREARTAAIVAYGADPAAYVNLGAMSEETWATTLDGARGAHEAKLEAARQAELVRVEAERIVAEKREAARVERVKLEAERVERERLVSEENARLKIEKEQLAAAAALELEEAAAKAADVERQREVERAAETIRAITAAEEVRQAREETDKAAKALAHAEATAAQAKADAEAATLEREAAELAERQAALLAPDREKLATFAATLRALALPVTTTAKGKAATARVAEQLAKMAAWVEKTGAAL